MNTEELLRELEPISPEERETYINPNIADYGDEIGLRRGLEEIKKARKDNSNLGCWAIIAVLIVSIILGAYEKCTGKSITSESTKTKIEKTTSPSKAPVVKSSKEQNSTSTYYEYNGSHSSSNTTSNSQALSKGSVTTKEYDESVPEGERVKTYATSSYEEISDTVTLSSKERRKAEKQARKEARKAEKEARKAEKQAREEARKAEKQAREEARKAEKQAREEARKAEKQSPSVD